MHTELLFSSTRYRVNQVWREQQRHRTRISRSNTSNILAERMVEGGGGGEGFGEQKPPPPPLGEQNPSHDS